MKLFCKKCGTLVAVVEKGSTIKQGTAMICRDCWSKESWADKQPEVVPGFLKSIFGVTK